MNMKSRLIIAGASLLLVLTFFFPVWQIDLNAPQYPEGLGLRIWLNEIGGLKPNDLQSINGLNHYIGMQIIEPESIPELKVMPFIIVFMILFGLINAFIGKPILLKIWLVLFLVVAIVGLVDFYLWGYDYGHNLNPDAPIKVPGMTYQPPLLGSKQLLNINAVSLPAVSTYLIIISLAITTFVAFSKSFRLKENKLA